MYYYYYIILLCNYYVIIIKLLVQQKCKYSKWYLERKSAFLADSRTLRGQYFLSSSFGFRKKFYLCLFGCRHSPEFPGSSDGTWVPVWETWVQSLVQEDLLEKEMATHSSILAWKIPWMEEPGRLQSMGSQRVWHNWVTSLSLFRESWAK